MLQVRRRHTTPATNLPSRSSVSEFQYCPSTEVARSCRLHPPSLLLFLGALPLRALCVWYRSCALLSYPSLLCYRTCTYTLIVVSIPVLIAFLLWALPVRVLSVLYRSCVLLSYRNRRRLQQGLSAILSSPQDYSYWEQDLFNLKLQIRKLYQVTNSTVVVMHCTLLCYAVRYSIAQAKRYSLYLLVQYCTVFERWSVGHRS